MRTVTGYLNGAPVWSENVPASPGLPPIRGELVVGSAGSVALLRQSMVAKRAREKADPERWSKRQASFRESKRRMRASQSPRIGAQS